MTRVNVITTAGVYELDYEDDGSSPSEVAEHYMMLLSAPGPKPIAFGYVDDNSLIALDSAHIVGVQVIPPTPNDD